MNRIDGKTVTDLVEGLRGVTVEGDAQVICYDALPLRDAIPGCVTMIDEASRCEELRRTGSVAVVTSKKQPNVECTQIVCVDIHAAFAAIVKQFRYADSGITHSSIDASAQIEPTAVIGVGTRIDSGVVIGAHCRIGRDCHLMPGVVVMEGTQIGDNCVIYPRVVIYNQTRIDSHVNIHAGSVIGAHGFGYRQLGGKHVLSSQLGFVHIESFVDIGANTTIDRGTYGATRIGEGTKIDNLVQIAHNCHIGRHNLICSQVGIAGSARTGDHVILAGQVGIADHIALDDHVVVGAQAGVMEDLAGNQTYLGSPANSHRDQMQMLAIQRRLPDMRREMRTLKRDIDQIQKIMASSSAIDVPAAEPALTDTVDDMEGDQPTCLKFQRPAA